MSEPPPPPAPRSSEAIDSWKGIAAYLGRDVSTVMRWERSRNLPVHRLPGGRKATVYALATELDAWRCGAAKEPVSRRTEAERHEHAPAPSIAVLPFDNLSVEKENDYFCHGLADGIITALSRAKGLRVIARTSSFVLRGNDQGAQQIGAALGVDTLLVGSVQRSGGRARVSVQLVDCSDNRSIWADRYDCDMGAAFDVQDEIAARIAAALQMTLGDNPSPRPPVPEAYQLWLEGRYRQLNGRTLQDFAGARECYAKAIAADPTFGPAHLAISQQALQAAGFGVASPVAVRATILSGIERALAWDIRLGEAHAARGKYLALFEFDWAGRPVEARRALEQLDALARTAYVSPIHRAWVHVGLGEADEAFEWLDRGIDARDPHVLHLPVKPHYDSLRQDARFGALMSKLRLPAAAPRRFPFGSHQGPAGEGDLRPSR